MSKLYFLVGPARSGKSTLANDWLYKKKSVFANNRIETTLTEPKDSQPRVVVSGDDIRFALHGQAFISETEGFVHAIKYVMIKTLLDRGHHVLHDGTNTSESSIRKLFEIAPYANYIIMTTSKKECKTRAIKTNQQYLLPVIERQFNNLEKLATRSRWYGHTIVSFKDKIANRIERIREEYL